MEECRNKYACPHLGFASCEDILAERERLRKHLQDKDTLIQLAAEEIENLRAENEKLEQEKESLQTKLKRRLRKDLGIPEPDGAEEDLPEETSSSSEPDRPEHKRGAPDGHRGATRKKPDHVDRVVDVYTEKCPRCGSGSSSTTMRFLHSWIIPVSNPRITARKDNSGPM